MMNPGVYFLLKGKRVIYIGQSTNLPYRVMHHHKQMKFTSVRFISCDRSLLSSYEKRWISLFQPEFNINHNPQSFHYGSHSAGRPAKIDLNKLMQGPVRLSVKKAKYGPQYASALRKRTGAAIVFNSQTRELSLIA